MGTKIRSRSRMCDYVTCSWSASWSPEFRHVRRCKVVIGLWRLYCAWLGAFAHCRDFSSAGSSHSCYLEWGELSFWGVYCELDYLWYTSNPSTFLRPQLAIINSIADNVIQERLVLAPPQSSAIHLLRHNPSNDVLDPRIPPLAHKQRST